MRDQIEDFFGPLDDGCCCLTITVILCMFILGILFIIGGLLGGL